MKMDAKKDKNSKLCTFILYTALHLDVVNIFNIIIQIQKNIQQSPRYDSPVS